MTMLFDTDASTAVTPDIVDPALGDITFAGGLNENKNDEFSSLVTRIMNLDRQDYAAPAERLHLNLDSQGHFEMQAGDYHWYPTPYALGQLGDRLSPGLTTFGERLTQDGHNDLRQEVLNKMLHRAGDYKFQVRTVQPNGHRLARAVVSEKFKPIDDDFIVPRVTDVITSRDGSFNWKALGGQLTHTRSHITFLRREPTVTGFGPNNRDLFVGFQYSNSEVGQGKCCFHLFLYDGFCTNGLIYGQKSILDVNFRHIGSAIKTNFGVISEERVRQHELTQIAGMVEDATATVLSKDFGGTVREELERAESRKLEGDKTTAIRELVSHAGVAKRDFEKVLGHWDSREDNAFGVTSAITRLAQDAPSYTERVALETAGGKVMNMTDQQWKSVMALAS